MLVAQNSLGPVCPVPLTVRGNAGPCSTYPDKDWMVALYKPDCSRDVAPEFQRLYSDELGVYICTDTRITKRFVSCGTSPSAVSAANDGDDSAPATRADGAPSPLSPSPRASIRAASGVGDS